MAYLCEGGTHCVHGADSTHWVEEVPDPGITCLGCYGFGGKVINNHLLPCPGCAGTGNARNGPAYWCEACAGTGELFTDDDQLIDCPTCDGVGMHD
jgi:DnaJ-class molecular chaperone